MKNEDSNKSEEIRCSYCGKDVSGEFRYYFPGLDKRLCTSCRDKHELLYKLLRSDEYLAQEKKHDEFNKTLAPKLFDETCCCCGRKYKQGELRHVFPYIYRSMCYDCAKDYRWYFERMLEANDTEQIARARSEEPVFCDGCGMRIEQDEVYLNLIATGKNLCKCCNNCSELRDKLQKEQAKIRIMNTYFKHKLYRETEKDKLIGVTGYCRNDAIDAMITFKQYVDAIAAFNHYKKEESALKMIAKRKMSVDKEVEVNKFTKLNGGDIIKVIIGGKAYDAKIVTNDFYMNGVITLTANVNQEVSKTWDVLGYDSFEDMIDDIAKEHKHVDDHVELVQKLTRLFADDKVVLSYNDWALRAEFDSKERMNAFLNLIKVEKCFHIKTDFDVDQNVYKLLVEWKE